MASKTKYQKFNAKRETWSVAYNREIQPERAEKLKAMKESGELLQLFNLWMDEMSTESKVTRKHVADFGGGGSITCSEIGSKFKLYENGCAAIAYHDGTRLRFANAYVGENVKAEVWYVVNTKGEFVEVV
ncbi:MAG TPA: hypothetical protein VIH30_08630 [Aquirhabdus sp.]